MPQIFRSNGRRRHMAIGSLASHRAETRVSKESDVRSIKRGRGHIRGASPAKRGIEASEWHLVSERVVTGVTVRLRKRGQLTISCGHATRKRAIGNCKSRFDGYIIPTVGSDGATAAKLTREQEGADITLGRQGTGEHGACSRGVRRREADAGLADCPRVRTR